MAPLAGRPLVRHAAAALRSAVERGVLQGRLAVVRDLTSPLAALLEADGLMLVEAPDSDQGLGHSLRAGLEAAERSIPRGPAAVVIALGDQPDIDPDVVEHLVLRWRTSGADAVRPRYSGEPDVPGHPVLLDRRLWTQAERLSGDAGLGKLLRGGGLRLELVDVSGHNPDIDTRADLLARDHPMET
jgi:CTP:molybdopterin cytidylyltransferase MocA